MIAASVMDSPLPWGAGARKQATPGELKRWGGARVLSGGWLVEIIASRRFGKPVVPRVFWYMSIIGSLMTLAYFVFGKNDSVGVLQNLFPAFTASYSLYLDIKHRGWRRDRATH